MKDRPNSRFVGMPKTVFDFDWMRRVGRKLDAICNVLGDGCEALISDSNFRIVVPTQATALTPFQPYFVGSKIRIHGGNVLLPEFYPEDTTQREIEWDDCQKLIQPEGTDGIFDDSAGTGSGENDLTLEFDTNSRAVISLKVHQTNATPGEITTEIVVDYGDENLTRPCTSQPQIPGEEIFRVPLGIVTADGAITKLVNANIIWPFAARPTRYTYAYDSTRIFFPGEIAGIGGISQLAMVVNPKPIIGYNFASGKWVRFQII